MKSGVKLIALCCALSLSGCSGFGAPSKNQILEQLTNEFAKNSKATSFQITRSSIYVFDKETGKYRDISTGKTSERLDGDPVEISMEKLSLEPAIDNVLSIVDECSQAFPSITIDFITEESFLATTNCERAQGQGIHGGISWLNDRQLPFLENLSDVDKIRTIWEEILLGNMARSLYSLEINLGVIDEYIVYYGNPDSQSVYGFRRGMNNSYLDSTEVIPDLLRRPSYSAFDLSEISPDDIVKKVSQIIETAGTGGEISEAVIEGRNSVTGARNSTEAWIVLKDGQRQLMGEAKILD